MAREVKKERSIDSNLIFAYACTSRLGDLEVLVTSPNVANIQDAGDRCFEAEHFEAARILYEK